VPSVSLMYTLCMQRSFALSGHLYTLECHEFCCIIFIARSEGFKNWPAGEPPEEIQYADPMRCMDYSMKLGINNVLWKQ
jgi:hypothetical protein